MANAKNPLYFGAAAATAIAGMLHVMLGPNNLGFNVNQGILFIVGGIAQIFWIIPMIRQWGKIWYGIGIAGTAVFMALFFITRVQGNPITGRGGGANPMSILVEIFQAIFIGITVAIIIHESRKDLKSTPADRIAKKDRRSLSILAGIVIALILIAAFVLPMTIPRPMGGPQGQGGGPSSGQNGPQAQTATQSGVSINKTCAITPSLIEVEGTPQQIEGPYFVDGMPNRSDIRADSDGSIEEGVPLTLTITVYDVDNGTCIPISGAHVDIWHANSQGVYSSIQQQGTSGTNFLRGYQITGDNGTVKFTTIYPGWYEGRAIHIHFKVRTLDEQEKVFEWTSQLYLPNSINEQVHTLAPYSTHGPVDMPNEDDGIYAGPSTDGLVQSNTGQHLMLDLKKQNDGYSGTFNVVVDVT